VKTHDNDNDIATNVTTPRRRTTMEKQTTKSSKTPSTRFSSAIASGAVLLSLFAGACAEEMDPASLVEKTRVLGARVEVEGAPERATPRPGETVNVAWLVTAPEETPPLGWAFLLCPGASGGNDVGCVGEPLAIFRGKDSPAQMKITIPAREALGGAPELVLFGRICADSEPVLDAIGRPRCTNDADGTTATVSITLELDDWSNRNPSLGADAFSFAGQPWPQTDQTDPAAGCAQLPQVKPATKDHVIRLETDDADRESFVVMQGDPARPTSKRERLQISQFTTAGKLERAFSNVEADDTAVRSAIEVKWEAPAADKIPAGGLVVRFTFVARDMRGGLAWTTRSACVMP
jgi:hypothetical protein